MKEEQYKYNDLSDLFKENTVKMDDEELQKMIDEEDGYYGIYDDRREYSCTGDYGPSNPWDAPGMSISDFL